MSVQVFHPGKIHEGKTERLTRPGLPPLNNRRFQMIVSDALSRAGVEPDQRADISDQVASSIWDSLQQYGVV